MKYTFKLSLTSIPALVISLAPSPILYFGVIPISVLRYS